MEPPAEGRKQGRVEVRAAGHAVVNIHVPGSGYAGLPTRA
jgi:hypothetical protein